METTLSSQNFLEPNKLVKSFNLESGDYIADFGTGHGFFAMAMARMVGGNGKVYAIDIQKSELEIIRARAKIEHLLNIETLWADLDQPQGSRLKDQSIDFVLIANMLFQSENKPVMIQEAYRVLREKGRLAIIEWDETPGLMGPPQTMRVSKESLKDLGTKAGFKTNQEFEAGSHHYGLLFEK